MRTKFILILICAAVSAKVSCNVVLPDNAFNIPDSLLLNADEEDMVDTIGKTRINEAKKKGAFDGMRYVMESRYRNYGDSFSKKPWHDHLFIDGGIGLEQLVAKGNNYHFSPLTSLRLGLGKQLSKLSTARITLGASYGYEKEKDLMFLRMGGKLDYFYSLSSYFSGYNPSRTIDVAAMGGFGAMYSKLEHSDAASFVPEAHIGARLSFFTGPQAYLSLEPYVGIASDKSDIVINNNGKKYDMFYGASLSFVYYIHNNLSPESRARFMRNKEYIVPGDSVLRSWRAPWFIEVANGINFLKSPSPEIGLSETLGHDMSLSVGRWLSSAIGLRLSAFSRTAVWRSETVAEQESPYAPGYTAKYNTIYTGARIEGLLNPLGFGCRYNWDRNIGAYLLFGGELGRFSKYQSGTHLSCRSEAYTAGLRFWTRIASDLHLYIEPRFSHNVYHIPYTNVEWNKLYNDDSYTVSAGLSLMLRSKRFRDKSKDSDNIDTNNRWVVGIAGGTNLYQTKSPEINSGGSGCGYNGLAYLEYRYSGISGVRLAFDYVSIARTTMTDFMDNTLADDGSVMASTERTGLWNHRYNIGLVSLSYDADLTTLFGGYGKNDSGFTLNMFAGPSLAVIMGETGTLDVSERLRENHECALGNSEASGMEFGVNLGFKLSYHLNRHLSVVLVPALYLMGSNSLHTLESPTSKPIIPVETLNLGVQYRF